MVARLPLRGPVELPPRRAGERVVPAEHDAGPDAVRRAVRPLPVTDPAARRMDRVVVLRAVRRAHRSQLGRVAHAGRRALDDDVVARVLDGDADLGAALQVVPRRARPWRTTVRRGATPPRPGGTAGAPRRPSSPSTSPRRTGGAPPSSTGGVRRPRGTGRRTGPGRSPAAGRGVTAPASARRSRDSRRPAASTSKPSAAKNARPERQPAALVAVTRSNPAARSWRSSVVATAVPTPKPRSSGFTRNSPTAQSDGPGYRST